MEFDEQVVYATNPDVTYTPFIKDGRVGYRVHTNDNGEPREDYIYFNPSTDADDGMPNVFVYQGGDNDPEIDTPVCHINIEHMVFPPRDMRARCCFVRCFEPGTHQVREGDAFYPMCDKHYEMFGAPR